MKKLLITILSVITLAGCTNKIAEYSIMSNRNIDVTHAKNFTRGERVEGVDGAFIATIISLGTPNISTALTKAIDKDRCTVALTDVTVEHNTLWLIYLGIHNARVTGRQLIDTSLPGCNRR